MSEKQLTEALPKIEKAATPPNLKAVFHKQLGATIEAA